MFNHCFREKFTDNCEQNDLLVSACQALQIELQSPHLFLCRASSGQIAQLSDRNKSTSKLVAITMQDSSEISILVLQFEGLQSDSTLDGFHPMKITFNTLKKWAEQKQNTNQKKIYVDCRDRFVKIRQTPRKLTNGNENALKCLEGNIAQVRIVPRLLKYDIK